MTLKNKILIGHGIPYLLMGLVVIWAVVNLLSLGKATDGILSENYRSILAAENMVDALERQDSGILILHLGNAVSGIAQFRKNEAVFLQWLARAKDNITILGEDELVRSIEADYAVYRSHFSKLTDLQSFSETVDTVAGYQTTTYPLFSKVRNACIDLRDLNEKTMYAASLKASQVAKKAIWSTVGVAAVTLFIALAFSILLAQRIIQPIRHFVNASRRISKGDYAVKIPVGTHDELGHLAEEFNSMATQVDQYHKMNIDQIIAEKNKGEAILSSIEDGLVVFDVTLGVTGINPAARRLADFGFSEKKPLLCADIFHDPIICDLVRKVVETGISPVTSDEQRVLTIEQDGKARQYLCTVTAIRGKDRSLSGAILLLRDVTRLKEVERLKSEFVMAASHELRTPLTSLGMSVDLLLEHAVQGLAKKDIDLLQAAHEEVHRMKALVNDLLDLSRIEAGRIDLEFECVPVSILFDHAEAVFKNQTDMKEVSLTSELAGGMPMVRADANKITWVLSNLISNALRYVSKGGHIGLSAYRIGPHVHLSVQDDGPGIPPEYQSKIFQKFVQVKGQETGGTGLGLAICKEIVRAHGGAIWMESSAGQGSTFIFTLPVA
ncbi:PAS domain-containing sensor histidine kinase [Desulfosarcina widdelii]|uniref:histidine kinase n=1 Tax=Desulfosarcina widdelii TaxID=947919 RepID=A0A5K7ZJF7_9BACT|nr:ATP-binding protein [Desulfosarcina widdelii]BBO76207.1 PAS domain-containing sensor histidine kinase [Desulfosarcina widdelii]